MNQIRIARCFLVPLFGLLLMSSASAQGQHIKSTHEIVRVTVLADRAEVVRRVTATALKGNAIVVIEGLPPELDERTLRVGPAEGLDIQGISSDIVKREIKPETERLPLLKEVNEKKKRISVIEASVLGLRRKVELARSYRTKTLDIIGLQAMLPANDLPNGKLELDTWGKALALLSAQELQALKKIRELEVERFGLGQDVKDLEVQLADHASPRIEDVRRVHVGLSSPVGGQIAFDLIYRIAGPTWRVRYDMRYDSKKSELHIEGYGVVFQKTGERWKDIDLILSNRMPVSGLRVPRVSPLILEGQELDAVVSELAAYSENVSVGLIPFDAQEEGGQEGAQEGNGGNQNPDGLLAPRPIGKAIVSGWKARPGLEDFVTLESSLTGQAYRVLQKQSLPSGLEPRQVSIFKATVPATLVLESVPSISGTVYRRVTATNSAQQSLLAGKAALHFDGNLVGLTSTATVAPSGRLELSFGAVSGLNVVMDGIDEDKKRDGKMVNAENGSKVYSFGRRFTLFNQSDEAAQVRILDTIPVSEVKSISVRVDKTASSKHKLLRPGILSFDVEAKVNQSATSSLFYKIMIP